jgi:signal transduction histidine kinase
MSHLFRWFRRVSFMEEAIAVWREADHEMSNLTNLAEGIHQEVASHDAPTIAIASLGFQVDASNRRLTVLEDHFSEVLGTAARWIGLAVFWCLLCTGAVIFVLTSFIQANLLAGIRTAERRMRERQPLEALEESLRRNESMAALGELVAGVAHAVRNPLFAISANVDAFEILLREKPEHREFIATLRAELARLTRMMRNLLEYGKPRNPSFAPADPAEVFEEAVDSLRPLATQHCVLLELHADKTLPAFVIDSDRVIELLQNLVENAVLHSPPGSTVVVEAQPVDRSGELWTMLSVNDSGTGFAEADIAHVFQPFFSRRPGGNGLGLSIVQRITADHGGHVSVANRSEGGASVAVELPNDRHAGEAA